MATQHSREIIINNLKHKSPGRIGITFETANHINDMIFGNPGTPSNYTPKRWLEGSFEYYDDEWGNIWRRMKDGCQNGEIHKNILEDWSKLDELKAPHYDVNEAAKHFKNDFNGAESDKFKMANIWGWVFNDARYIRNMSQYFMDLVIYPAELKKLHSLICDYKESIIHAAGKAGADGIFIGEDMGTQTGLLFSPDMFKQFFKEDYTRLFGIAHEYGMKVFMHSCGSNREILDDLCDCGIDCFQFDQPLAYDMEELADFFKKRKVALWSPVDIQKVLPSGNKEFIVSQTRKMCKLFNGFLICKNYGDLDGIGVKEEWDEWAYDTIVEYAGL